MKKNKSKPQLLLQLIFTLFLLLIISGCQSINTETPGDLPQNNPAQKPGSESQNASESKEVEIEPSNQNKPEEQESDPEVINLQWENSAHATSFVTDINNQNNSCAKCHAPIEWMPTVEDLPESCFTCKFELSEPPKLINESQWQSITCKVCHQTDKKGNVLPEFSWLEVAALEEYTEVESVNELCMKCHAPSNIPDHVAIELGGAHADFQCTDCHNAHELTTSCGDSSCHETLQDPEKIIPGHDEDHSDVACEACHDASDLEVGPDEESGIWTTFATWAVESEGNTESGITPFVSHNTVLEADCSRCHFADNPWDLTVEIELP